MSRILFILNVLLLTPSNLHVYVITALVQFVLLSVSLCTALPSMDTQGCEFIIQYKEGY